MMTLHWMSIVLMALSPQVVFVQAVCCRVTDAVKRSFLDAHNELRQNVNITNNLVWDNDLAQTALEQNDNCETAFETQRGKNCWSFRYQITVYDESLCGTWPESLARLWGEYIESMNQDDRQTCITSPGVLETCRNYSQMVYQPTHSLGCAICVTAITENGATVGHKVASTCHYNPPLPLEAFS